MTIAAGVSKNLNVTHQNLAILKKIWQTYLHDLDLRKNFKTLKEYLIQGKIGKLDDANIKKFWSHKESGKITENVFKVHKFNKELSFRIYRDFLLKENTHSHKPKRKWTKDMKKKFVK